MPTRERNTETFTDRAIPGAAPTPRPIRVLIVDDSALVRQALSRILSRDPEIEVVGTAADPYLARDKMVQLNPHVLTLDVEMPRMDGITFLKRLMVHRPTPVIILSGITASGTRAAVEALAAGAVQVLEKPGPSFALSEMAPRLVAAVKAAAATTLSGVCGAATATLKPIRPAAATRPAWRFSDEVVVALGASTGGVDALTRVLAALPADAPPILVVQHMPPRFTSSFAERLATTCRLEVKEAADGDTARIGRVLIAPGGQHMRVVRDAVGGYRVRVSEEPPVSHQRPSVDVLFDSVALHAGWAGVAAILTGMGDDGAAGLLRVRQAGGATIAQDQATCAVFGMPAAAIARGAAQRVVPLDEMADHLLEIASRRERASSAVAAARGLST